jgi:hypothetical protein
MTNKYIRRNTGFKRQKAITGHYGISDIKGYYKANEENFP